MGRLGDVSKGISRKKEKKKVMFTYVYSYHAALVFVGLFVDRYFATITCTCTIRVCNPCTVSGSGYVIRYYVSGRKISIWW